MPIVAEVSERTGYSRAHVRWLCAHGRLLGAYRRGRDWWVPDVAVDRLLAERASSRHDERTPA